MGNKLLRFCVFLFWLGVVIIYPMLLSIYVTLPLFIGFAGLIFILGLKKHNNYYILFSFIYMLNLEINLSLPLFLLPIAVLLFYIFVSKKLLFLKLCQVCIYIITVVSINIIYFLLVAGYDFIEFQNSINYDNLILFSILYDIIAAVLL